MEEKRELLSRKPFRSGDVVIYIALVAIVALCFILSAFSVKKGASFDVYSKGRIVLHYSFEDGSYRIFDGCVEKSDGDIFTVKCDGGYNVLSVDRAARDVTVKDADCVGKECELMKLSNGSIVCAPHSLLVRFSGEDPSPKAG